MQDNPIPVELRAGRIVGRARAILLVGRMLLAAAAHAADPVSDIERVDGSLNKETSVFRHIVNECVIAGIASVVVAMSVTGPIAPAVAASLGASPGMSAYGIGALGCGSGAVAGAVSAAMIYVWEDRAVVGEAIATPIVTAWQAIEPAYEWSIAGLLSRGGEVVVSTIGSSTSGLLAWLPTPSAAVQRSTALTLRPAERPRAGDRVQPSYQPDVTAERLLPKRIGVVVP